MGKIGKFIGLLGFMLFASLGRANEVEVVATVDRNVMEEGDTFILAVSVTSGSSVTVEDPRLPSFKNMDLINSWSASETRSSFSNGKFNVEQTRTFNYMLAPNRTGQFRIDPVEVVVNGQAYNTRAIDVTVKKAGATPGLPRAQRPQGNPNQPLEELDDLFSQLLRRRNNPGFKAQPTNPNESFFLQVDVDKTTVFAGEQVTASWFLYTRGHIRDIDTLKYPSLNGFWKEEIDLATRLDFQQEVINGIVYRKALLASYALFPIKPGKAKIDSYKAKCTVITDSAFGFGRPYVYTKSSKPVSIEVLPIPKENRPADFSGAVGQFSVSSSLSESSVAVNQPVTLKVRFDGRGNGKLIDLPPLDLPPSIEIYDTKKESKFFKNGQSYKEFEVLLIPREAGEIKIPSMSVSLFDPKSAKFYSKQTTEMTLTVTPATGQQAISSTPLSVEGQVVAKQKADALPDLALGWEASSWRLPIPQVAFWPVVYLGVFLLLFWWAALQFGLFQKGKDIARIIKLRSDRIHKMADKGEWRAVGVEGTNLIYFILGEVSEQGGGGGELEKLLLQAPPSVHREMEEPVRKLMASLEALGFAPEEMIGELKEKKSLQKVASNTTKIVEHILSLSVASSEDLENSGGRSEA